MMVRWSVTRLPVPVRTQGVNGMDMVAGDVTVEHGGSIFFLLFFQ